MQDETIHDRKIYHKTNSSQDKTRQVKDTKRNKVTTQASKSCIVPLVLLKNVEKKKRRFLFSRIDTGIDLFLCSGIVVSPGNNASLLCIRAQLLLATYIH
jgi:hypothetical protein